MTLHKCSYESLFNEFGNMPLMGLHEKTSSLLSVVTELPVVTDGEFSAASKSSYSCCPAIQSSSLFFLIPNP